MSDELKSGGGVPPALLERLQARITEYLAVGGLFNPELIRPQAAVSRLLSDCRDGLAEAAQQIRTLREPPRRFPIMGGPSVPWALMEPHERQAQENHDQTLQRLAERGGLSPCEAVALLEDRKQQAMDHAEATRQLQAFIDNDLTAKFEAQIRTLQEALETEKTARADYLRSWPTDEPVFRVWDRERACWAGAEGRDLEAYALDEFKADKLVYCDMEGWALADYGELYLLDECGNHAAADPARYEVRVNPRWLAGKRHDAVLRWRERAEAAEADLRTRTEELSKARWELEDAHAQRIARTEERDLAVVLKALGVVSNGPTLRWVFKPEQLEVASTSEDPYTRTLGLFTQVRYLIDDLFRKKEVAEAELEARTEERDTLKAELTEAYTRMKS